MKDGGGNVAGQLGQVSVGLKLHTWFPLLRLVLGQRRLRHDAPGDAQRVRRHLAVGLGAQVVGGNGGGHIKAGALDLDRAPAGGVQVADAGGEGIKAVQRLTKGIEAQRLHVVFDVRVGLAGVTAGKGAQLRGRHAHRAGALEGVFQPDQGLAPKGIGLGVERLDAVHLEHRPDLQVVLQVGAHARRVMRHGHAVLLQKRPGTNAGELQDLGRANAAGAQYHLGAGRHRQADALFHHLRAGATELAIGVGLKRQLSHLRRGPQLEIGAAGAGGAQKGLGGVPAPAALLVDLKVAHTLVAALVEVVGGGNAGLLRRLRERVQHIPAQALLLDAPLTPATMQCSEIFKDFRALASIFIA